jgi:GSH-dependent disulfide-bond oxidoreductase
MIDLYYWTTTNGHKITMFLEDTTTPYAIKPINCSKSEQFSPEVPSVSPNNHIPPSLTMNPATATISDAHSRQALFGQTASAVR